MPLRLDRGCWPLLAVEEHQDDGVRDGEQAVIIARIVVAVAHANRHLNGTIASVFVSPFSCRYHAVRGVEVPHGRIVAEFGFPDHPFSYMPSLSSS